MTERETILEVVNRLFIYTDTQNWAALQEVVFTPQVQFDMSSLGGEASMKSAKDICDEWQAGFEGLDAINHLAGNYLVTVEGDTAQVFAYATATHYKAAATRGTTREFVGTYNLGLLHTEAGWRINAFAYHLKYAQGNLGLE